jgi:hypothetical protein
MRRLAIALVILAAGCPGRNKKGDGGGGNSTGTAVATGTGARIKQMIVSWGTQPAGRPDADPPQTRVFLEVTDETGAATSYPLGEVAATCSSESGGDMGALGTLTCWYAGGGATFIAVARAGEVIVLRRWTDEGESDPADYEEQHRVTIPVGSKVSFAP